MAKKSVLKLWPYEPSPNPPEPNAHTFRVVALPYYKFRWWHVMEFLQFLLMFYQCWVNDDIQLIFTKDKVRNVQYKNKVQLN